jgi:hypothetical protein
MQIGDLDSLLDRQEPSRNHLLFARRLRPARRFPDQHTVEGVAAVLALDDSLGPITASALVDADLA